LKSKLTKSDQERFQNLLMTAVDDELVPEEKAEFERFVNSFPECKKEWQEYQKLKEVTKSMRLKSPKSEVWDNYWLNVYNRFERGIAWIIISIGCVILMTYGGFKAVESILADSQIAGIAKVGILLAIAGFVILFVSVIREKFFTHKSDPYKEIQR
jgi:hypothetical protein